MADFGTMAVPADSVGGLYLGPFARGTVIHGVVVVFSFDASGAVDRWFELQINAFQESPSFFPQQSAQSSVGGVNLPIDRFFRVAPASSQPLALITFPVGKCLVVPLDFKCDVGCYLGFGVANPEQVVAGRFHVCVRRGREFFVRGSGKKSPVSF